jgi:hypothetical protein
MIRPTKLGMKNWLLFGSLGAGKNNVLIYTLLANCLTQGLDQEAYLTDVLRRLWADKKAGGDRHTYLRHKIRSYRRRGSPRERHGRIAGQRMIDERPPEIEHRERIGEYGMGTVIGTPGLKPSSEIPR